MRHLPPPSPAQLRPLPRQEQKVSDGQQQWWGVKAQNFDSVLLFKQGKFYEVGAGGRGVVVVAKKPST